MDTNSEAKDSGAIRAAVSVERRSAEVSIEFRREIGKWEAMQGGAHRGLYDSEAEARAILAKVGA